jgi:hypothetical protein
MVSVGKVRLVSRLYDDSDMSFEPRIRDGIVEYPIATSALDNRDHPTTGALDDLADKGILDKQYATKSYICPGCTSTGLKYIGACPRCGTTHTIGQTVARHAGCSHTAPPSEFEQSDGSQHCPNCEVVVDSSDMEYDQRNVCRECEAEFADPDERMQCRDCLNTYSPVRVAERTLYDYALTAHGQGWYETQIRVRELLVERLESRGFETEVDAIITSADGEHPVHVYAEDPLLDTRLVADIHDEPSPSDVEYLQTAAEHADATGVVIVTTPSVPSEIAKLTEERGQNLLALGSDDALTREWTTAEASATSPSSS